MAHSNWRAVLSGGIGCGKSTVGEMLSARGAQLIVADAIGHEVLDGPARDAVAARWPAVVRSGRIDRAALAAVVFRHRRELRELEAITHPLIRARILARTEAASGPIVVELPLLGDLLGPDWIRIVVDAPDRIRIDRLLARGMAASEIARRMAAQPMRGEWLAAADVVIVNSGDRAALAAAVDRTWERLGGP